MSVPDADVNFLLDNLTQTVVYNYNLIADVRPNIVVLQRELQTLQGLLKDFTKYNHDSDYLEKLKNDIRTVVHQTEDLVDTYLIKSAVRMSQNWFEKLFNFDNTKELRDLGKQIEAISKQINQINQEKIRNGFQVLQYMAIWQLNEGTKELNKASVAKEIPVEEERIIGFDEYAKQVEELLTTGVEELEVVSIVGMLGLGKTTLARKVFNDPKVEYEYMIRAFVYVSKEYQKRDVLLRILTSFQMPCNEVYEMDEGQLEKYLYKQLEGKQYLVVLDDVWDEEDWDRFKVAFPNNHKRCRVLITTRYERVAKYANPNKASYKLDFLSLEQSRELLHWGVFREDKCPVELQEYEIRIAEKCDGLPLTIVVIAGILLNHPDKVDWWNDVAYKVMEYMARGQNKTAQVIEIMYKNLPNYLKPCFLYLGVFGEDYEIPVWKLVRLWIAEGLIQQEGSLNLEDIAEQYLDELVYRNVVMVGQRRKNDKIKTCFMHNTLRQFCKREAIEENLFREMEKDELDFFLSGNPALDQYRRLCLNNVNIVDYISGTPSGKCVRSFLTFVKETPVEPKLVACIPKTFKLLRVLEIQSLIFQRFPVDLCSLILLKYIAISSNFSILPEELSGLWNMQTLIVNTTSRELDIKADIWKMPHFRHLHTNTSTTLPSPDPKTCKETGKEIRTLTTIAPESCTREVFDRTPKLEKLGISGKISRLLEVDGETSLFSSLRKLEWLENLKLLNDDVDSKLYSLPSEKKFPRQLTKLTLLNTFLEWKEMVTLEKLENLEVLKLKEFAFQGTLWQPGKGGFCRLKHLYVGRTDLVVWEASVDHFPKLRGLELNGCDKLQAFPHSFPSLQLVVLHCTNSVVASSARRLQVLRLEQAKKGNKDTSSFKLSVYPPER